MDCVRKQSLKAFISHYQNWCKHGGYNFSVDKTERIYHLSSDLIAVFPKDGNTKMLIWQAVTILNTASETVESLRQKMNSIAYTLQEYSIVRAMNGVGPTLGPQLMAEIGDITQFTHRRALTAFAGVDSGKNDSGQRTQKSVRTSKKAHQVCVRHSSRSWTVPLSVPLLMTMFTHLWTQTGTGQTLLRLYDY